MTLHHADMLSFEAPTAWRNATIARFSPAPDARVPAQSITIERRPLAAGETLRTVAAQAVAHFAKAAAGMALFDSVDTTVDHREAIRFAFRFTRAEGVQGEQMTVFVGPAEGDEACVTIVTYAATLPKAEEARRVFERMLKSMVFAAVQKR